MGLMTLTACDDYLDINDSPNAISSVENDYILPTPEVNIASTVGVQFNVLGGYNAQVYGQNAGCSNYLDYSRFLVTASNCQGAWTQLYSRVLQQLEVIRSQSAEEPGTYLAATVLRAYAFQLIVDAWGEAPFTEALNPSITQPVYDDGAAIYASIISELEAAKAAAQPGDAVCANLSGEYHSHVRCPALLREPADIHDRCPRPAIHPPCLRLVKSATAFCVPYAAAEALARHAVPPGLQV